MDCDVSELWNDWKFYRIRDDFKNISVWLNVCLNIVWSVKVVMLYVIYSVNNC